MTKKLAGAALLLLALAGCAVPSDPIPQDTIGAPVAEAKPATKPKVSSCDVVREAFLTGTSADVKRALKRLKADKTADGTAREYAGYWLGRDAGDSQMQEMDQGLIVSSCTY